MNSDAWSTLDDINHVIRFADTKASILLAAGGVLGGTLLSRSPGDAGGLPAVSGAAWAAAVVAVAFSALFALGALLPRLSVRKHASSLIYFEDIARQFRGRQTEYVATFGRFATDPGAVRAQVAGQIWANSQVARNKFRNVTVATWLICFGLLGAAVSILLEGH